MTDDRLQKSEDRRQRIEVEKVGRWEGEIRRGERYWKSEVGKMNTERIKKMELTHVKEDENLIITIKGRLDAASSPEAGNAINKIMQKDCSRVLFNFSELGYLSSGGLRVILGVAKELKRKGGKLILCSLNPFVKEIFVVSGFESLIPIEDTMESGIRQLSAN